MRRAGRIVALTLLELQEHLKPGVTTAQLDEIAERTVRAMGARPAFKGYRGFPGSICASINDEVVHGIPSPQRVLAEGDIISIDFGAEYEGWFGDAAITVGVGAISSEAATLLAAGQGALVAGIRQAQAGQRLGAVSHAIQEYAESRGYAVVRQYVGHGIGRQMHEAPQIPNYGPSNGGPLLRANMALAIEPMLNVGGAETVVRPDKWTVVTQDGRLSCHFEHTVYVTTAEPEIMTLP
jgi:methionyl aminopeptidase